MALDQPSSSAEHLGNELRMTLGEHVEELRRYLIRSLLGIAVALAVTFYFGFELIGWMAQPLLQVQYALGYSPQTIETDPSVGFTNVYLPVTLIAATILASPWVIFQLWCFLVTGLYERERKTVYILAPFSVLMTALAVGFTYYILLPVSLLFFFSFASHYPDVAPAPPNPIMQVFLNAYGIEPGAATPSIADVPSDSSSAMAPDLPAGPIVPVLQVDPAQPAQGMIWINQTDGHLKTFLNGQVRVLLAATHRLITPMPRMGQYIKFAALTTLGIVIAFQVPVVMLVVGWTQWVDPRWVGRFRKYALFLCAGVGAILTPTDIFSMFVLALPLYALFELGLFLMRLTYKPAPDEL